MNLTFKQYRALDIIVFTVALCVCESILVFLWNKCFYGDPFIPSVLFVFLAIVYMRWGWQATIPAIICAVVASSVRYLTDGEYSTVNYFYELTGNAFSAFILIYIKVVKKDEIRKTWWQSAIFASLLYLLIELGRSVALFVATKSFGDAFSYFATHAFLRDLVAYAILLIGVLIVRRIDGLFEDQKAYLFRLEKQKQQST